MAQNQPGSQVAEKAILRIKTPKYLKQSDFFDSLLDIYAAQYRPRTLVDWNASLSLFEVLQVQLSCCSPEKTLSLGRLVTDNSSERGTSTNYCLD
jgi:hypothetical protein